MVIRYASYTNRQLTEQEKRFAEEHHNLMYRYMRIHELDFEEWYDILIIPYLQAVKKYHEYERLQQYKFEQIFFRTLDNARSNYWRDMNRQKRCPEGGVWSLDAMSSESCRNGEEDDKDSFSWVKGVSPQDYLEERAIDNVIIQNLLEELEQYKAKEIVNMLLDGKSGVEIRKRLEISSSTYYKLIAEIKRVLLQNV
mgnify:FL=1